MIRLTDRPFNISALLHHEAEALTKCCPLKGRVKAPNASDSTLTQKGKKGKGPGHCVVMQWPSDQLPGAWGARNRAVLLDETIQPEIWTKLSDLGISGLYARATFTRLVTPWQSSDEGNEEPYRPILAKIFKRLTAIAFIFFLNQWLKPQNADNPDWSEVLATLHHFEVVEEHTTKTSCGNIRCDAVIQIGRSTPIRTLKHLPGIAKMVNMSMANLKSTGNAEHEYYRAFKSPSSGQTIRSVDQAMGHAISYATSIQGVSVQDLTTFLSAETTLQWPHMATSHFSQVISIGLSLKAEAEEFYRWPTSWIYAPAPVGYSRQSGASTESASSNTQLMMATMSMSMTRMMLMAMMMTMTIAIPTIFSTSPRTYLQDEIEQIFSRIRRS